MSRIKYWAACAAKLPVVRSEAEKEGNRKIVEMLHIYIKMNQRHLFMLLLFFFLFLINKI